MRFEQPKPNEWVQPVRRGYKLACCDCGLVHLMDFRIWRGRVQFRANLYPASTAAMRGWMTRKRNAEAVDTRPARVRDLIGVIQVSSVRGDRWLAQVRALIEAADALLTERDEALSKARELEDNRDFSRQGIEHLTHERDEAIERGRQLETAARELEAARNEAAEHRAQRIVLDEELAKRAGAAEARAATLEARVQALEAVLIPQVMDALESDDHDDHRAAFEAIQEAFEPEHMRHAQ